MAVISQYQVVIAGQIITAALWNGMELNIINNGLLPVGIEDYSTNDAQAQTQTDPYPASVLSKATDLAGEVARLRYQLAQITGETYWYIDPDVDIATFKTRFDAHTHDSTSNNGPKLTVSGLADDAVETAKIKDLNVTTGKIAALAVTDAKINDVASSKITGSLNRSQIQSVYFSARDSANANSTGNSTRAFLSNYASELSDSGSVFNHTTGIFTAPVTGRYVFTGRIEFNDGSGGTLIDARLAINGTASVSDYYVRTFSPPGNPPTINFSFLVPLTSGDTVQLTAVENGLSLVVDPVAMFCGYLI